MADAVELTAFHPGDSPNVRRATRVEVVAAPSQPGDGFGWSRWTAQEIRQRSPHLSGEQLSTLSPRVRSFYLSQERLLSSFADVDRLSESEADDTQPLHQTDEEEDGRRRNEKSILSVKQATTLSMLANVVLFVIKIVATILSGSLSVMSSVVDSALDLFTGIVLWITGRCMQPSQSERYVYPIGKRRLEPVAIVICAAVMGTASLQLIVQSAQSLVKGDADPDLNPVSGGIVGITVIVKVLLYLLCRQLSTPSVKALALDHRNDVASNSVAIIFGLLGTYVQPWFDPVGAILIALYIIVNWVRAGREQMQMLVGRAADSHTLQQLTWAAFKHHKDILQVDTVRAFHFGVNFIVEVDIVLPPQMPLQTAHDIGESLQQKLEKLERVERAFVHLDFESEHNPSVEHRSLVDAKD